MIQKGGEKMEKFIAVLKMLLIELERQSISDDRVLEIKETTVEMADKIDLETGVSVASGMVKDYYSTETKYLKRRVKMVVRVLLSYCEVVVEQKNNGKES